MKEVIKYFYTLGRKKNIKEAKIYYSDGRLCIHTFYYRNGNPKEKRDYEIDGRLYERTLYYKNGKVKVVENYE